MKSISDSLDEIISKLEEIEKRLDPYSLASDPVKVPDMWEHYCIVEGTYMSVLKDCECNWCGRTKDETTEYGKLGDSIDL
jgi:hypothetical protein